MKNKELTIDFGERIFILMLAVPFMLSMLRGLPTHPLSVLVAISEALAVIFILIRKPGSIATQPYPLTVAFIGTGMPLLIRLGDISLLPPAVTAVLMGSGLAINILAKLALNRSFGMVAANRGLKLGGPYRVVRHPMYLGYFVNQLGFLLSSFSWINLLIYIVAWGAQVLRIREEEKFLSQDPEYRDFMKRVPRRVLPGF